MSNSFSEPTGPKADDSATRELLYDAKAGNESAVNTLMDRHRQQIRNLVQMRLDHKIRQRVDVSDVVQDIFVAAFRRLSTYLDDPRLPFQVWLKQIAKDRMIDTYRKHRRAANRSIDRETRLGVSPSGGDLLGQQNPGNTCPLTPAAIAMQKELSLHVEEAIGQLKDTDSELIIMRHYQAMSNREIADQLNLSEATASVRYVRALAKLKKLLSDPAKSTNVRF
jgi:RNA polymerase sigma-70 factor (ECF subfamily)